MAEVDVRVARLGRPHGVRGELLAEPLTDEPEVRLRPGAVLRTEPPSLGPLTLTSMRLVSGRTVLGFADVTDRDGAERLRGAVLVAQVDDGERPADPEEFYDHQLVGLAAVTVQGQPVGVVDRVQHGGAQDLLVLALPHGRESLVPFVAALVPEVDLAGGRVVLDLPEGLLELSDDDAADQGEPEA
ncbi:MAG: ribosome maturation factor RimM [Actinomycetes bacterium]